MRLLALEQQGLKATALGSVAHTGGPCDLQGREEAGRLFLPGLCVGRWYSALCSQAPMRVRHEPDEVPLSAA